VRTVTVQVGADVDRGRFKQTVCEAEGACVCFNRSRVSAHLMCKADEVWGGGGGGTLPALAMQVPRNHSWSPITGFTVSNISEERDLKYQIFLGGPKFLRVPIARAGVCALEYACTYLVPSASIGFTSCQSP
jgi:hypothetical protein